MTTPQWNILNSSKTLREQQTNSNKTDNPTFGLVQNEQRKNPTKNQHRQLNTQTTPQMQRGRNYKPPKKRTQTSQQNTQHRNSRSKRTLHVQTSRKKCTISGNEQQSRMESNTEM